MKTENNPKDASDIDVVGSEYNWKKITPACALPPSSLCVTMLDRSPIRVQFDRGGQGLISGELFIVNV